MVAGTAAAQTPRVDLSEVSRYAMEGGSVPWPALLIAAGLIVVVLSVLALVRRLQRGPLEPHPLQHYDRVARSLGLSVAQRLLLVRIARQQKLETPLTLLASSGALHQLGRQYAAGLPVERRKRVFRSLSSIQRRVFLAEEPNEGAERAGETAPGERLPAHQGPASDPLGDKPYAPDDADREVGVQGSTHAH